MLLDMKQIFSTCANNSYIRANGLGINNAFTKYHSYISIFRVSDYVMIPPPPQQEILDLRLLIFGNAYGYCKMYSKHPFYLHIVMHTYIYAVCDSGET